MFSHPIEIWDTRISGIVHKLKNGVLVSRIVINGVMTHDLAKILERDALLYLENGAPRLGFSKLELDTGCKAFRALFEVDPALKQSFEFTGDSVDELIVERKKAGDLRVKAFLHYHGDPYLPLAYVMAVGELPAILKISPLQQELEEAQDAEVTLKVKTANGAVSEHPVAKETIRQALAASRVNTGKHVRRRP